MCLISATDRGCWPRRRATRPATKGDAIEVPLRAAYEPWYVEVMPSPGAATKTSGEPKLEKTARVSVIVDAATPIAPGQPAGAEAAEVFSLPAAATTTT